jgi:hypothetical protein
MPTKAAKKRYGFYNYMLLAILLLGAVLISIYQPISVSITFLAYLYLAAVYVVFRYLIEYYSWLTFYGIIFLMVSIAVAFMNPDESFSIAIMVIILLFCAPVIFLPWWLQKKLCPSPKMHLESYTDDEGVGRKKLIYEFPD